MAFYDPFRRTADGGRQWLGRTFDGAYCVPALALGASTGADRLELELELELEAVSPTGRRSKSARTTLTW
ncbi:hypothetical protein KN815_21390 [Streptomyces sp. 4503]|uniref:Uncharacterized protein n=1 Tax=Streptomyces niphimycinicus TaxID=2842201 RepID=A0ABS6CHW9_9ACTN|nr:hypothetical protein [Streptomyces niphimycinicus]MBU3866523.1 hypothetical protein [Streptomyces niphimycinicus]